MEEAVAYHRGHGTTATLVSLMTAPEAELIEQLGWAAELARRGAQPRGHVLGSHLEGPFLSPRRCGAQNALHMVAPPTTRLLERLRAPPARRCNGHDRARAERCAAADQDAERNRRDRRDGPLGRDLRETRAGIGAGAGHATHLFNAMRPLHHREPGLVGAALEAGMNCELINDGRHVHPAVVRLVFELISSPVLVTDAIDAAGVGDGRFELGGQEVQVHGDEARLADDRFTGRKHADDGPGASATPSR